jgi:hypothetical protein
MQMTVADERIVASIAEEAVTGATGGPEQVPSPVSTSSPFPPRSTSTPAMLQISPPSSPIRAS